jgi:hypothetical protein
LPLRVLILFVVRERIAIVNEHKKNVENELAHTQSVIEQKKKGV